MIVYFSVLIIICLICFFDRKGDGKRPLLISVGLIYLMITLQEGWGGDAEAYMTASDWYFNSKLSLNDLMGLEESEKHGELGYKIMYTYLPYRVTVFLCAVFLCTSLYILMFKFVPRKYWSLFFIIVFINRYMLMGDISALPRNGFAVSLFLIAIFFLSEGKRAYYLLIVILAAFFHRSVLIFLPLFFVPSKPFKVNPVFGTIALLFLAMFSAITPESWSSVVASFIEGSNYLDNYSHYLEETAAHFDVSLLLPFIIFWGYCILTTINKEICTKGEYLILNIALITVLFKLLPGLGMSDRLYFYMDYCFFAGILIYLSKTKEPAMRLLVVLSFLFVYGRWFFDFMMTPHFIQHWMHYNPIFSFSI